MPTTPKTAWGQSTRIEQQYNRSLQQLRKQINQQLQGATTTAEISRRLQTIQNSPAFVDFAERMAANMAQQVYRESGVQWRKQAQEASRQRSRAIYEALQNELTNTPMGGAIQKIVTQNSSLIKTIPDRLNAELVSTMAKESAQKGIRHEQLTQDILSKFDNLMEYEARRIARTETSKAQTALTQTRAQNLGINWYVWRTAGDGMRVRQSHRHLEGVLVSWNNPPNPESLAGVENSQGSYHAGNIYNCRCYSEPLIDIDWVSWPCKVFVGGAIVTMSREQFIKMESGDNITEGLNISAESGKIVVTAKECTDMQSLNLYMKDNHGIKVDSSLDSLHFESVRESTAGVEDILNDFPQMKGQFTELGLTSSKGAVMDCSYSGKIGFSPHYFADAQKSSYAVRLGLSGHSPPNHSLRGIGRHEAGHLIEGFLLRNDDRFPMKVVAWNDCTVAKEIVSEAVKAVKKTDYGKGRRINDLINDISGYATFNRSEALAEAVADWYTNGDNANPLSIEIMKVIRGRM